MKNTNIWAAYKIFFIYHLDVQKQWTLELGVRGIQMLETLACILHMLKYL